jgi:HlyD family secretion protein
MNRISGLKRYVWIVAPVAIVLAFIWFAATSGPLAPVKVVVAKAETGALERRVFGIGTVEARYVYAIGPTQPGRIARLLVDQGDSVKAGQVLGEMDPVDLDERIQAAEAAREKSVGALAVAKTQLDQARNRYDLAASNAIRYANLRDSETISAELAEAKVADADLAKAVQAGAEAALRIADWDIERTAADLRSLRLQKSYLQLTSRYDGVVVSREAEPGSTVVAGQAVLKIVDPKTLWIRARVDQADAGTIAPGQEVEIVLRSLGQRPLKGKVFRVELQGDSVTVERVVDIEFTEAAPLRLGELAEVTINTAVAPRALHVPAAAVKKVDGGYGIWKIENGKTAFCAVQTGITTLDGKTEITGGLRPGESFIVYSPAELWSGMKVKQVKAL